jgi:hypothetical protein
VDEIQDVYRFQGVAINDKHIEIIVRQMLKKVSVLDSGETNFLIGEQVDKIKFMEENQRCVDEGLKPAVAEPLVLGITQASLSTDSFISAASFQETTKVLTEASLMGKDDSLRGLKKTSSWAGSSRPVPAIAGTWTARSRFRASPNGRTSSSKTWKTARFSLKANKTRLDGHCDRKGALRGPFFCV